MTEFGNLKLVNEKKQKRNKTKGERTNYTYMFQKFISLENRFSSGLR